MAGVDRYLQNRAGTFRVRVRVPQECHPIIGRRELLQSLGTGSKTEARRLAPAVVARFLAMIEEARPRWKFVGYDPAFHEPHWVLGDRFHVGDSPPGADPLPTAPQEAPEAVVVDTPKTPTFTAILDLWSLENTNPDTLKKYTGMMAALAKHAGTDRADKITPQQIVGLETRLRQAGKLNVNTIASYLSAFSAVFTFAKWKFMITSNPMIDVKVPAKIDSQIQAYTIEQAARIVTEAQAIRPELFLCVAVQSLTGCRISEIADRRVADIKQEDGIWCLSIPAGKTKSSVRLIPLHPSLLALLLPYREAVIEKYGEGSLLFPELPRGGSGKPSVYATRELGRWLRKDLRIVDKRLQPNHSWRHFVKSKLLKAKVDVKIRDMIAGHGSDVARKYEHGDIEMMAEAIALLPDPGFAQECPCS
jgi:integrase